MFANKALDMFTEAIPGTLSELWPFAGEPFSNSILTVSLLISAMSAAMTSTSMFYDIDVAPDKRKNNPKW